MKNITVSVPDGTTNHGVENLICIPPRWYDFVFFFFANYLAHVFTFMNPPGATIRERFINALYLTFVPGSAIPRALRLIIFHARTHPGLETAARAGALCMVLKRENITPATRSPWFNNIFFNGDNPRLLPTNRSMHGTLNLPRSHGAEQEFFLVEVPPGTPLQELQNQPTSPPPTSTVSRWFNNAFHRHRRTKHSLRELDVENVMLGNDWNPFGLTVSLLQAGYGVYTLYKARGNQIETYGFTAFGLTVVPYVFMAIINIIAALVTPQFPCMFLIKTPDMQAIQSQYSEAHGTFIAEIKPEHRHAKIRLDFLDDGAYRRKLYEALLMFLFLAPLGIIVALSHSHFYVSGVRIGQVVFVSLWQISSAISPWWLRWVTWRMPGSIWQHNSSWKNKHFYRWLLTWLLQTIPVFTPAIGGMYYVGLMITEYGSCTRLDFTPF